MVGTFFSPVTLTFPLSNPRYRVTQNLDRESERKETVVAGGGTECTTVGVGGLTTGVRVTTSTEYARKRYIVGVTRQFMYLGWSNETLYFGFGGRNWRSRAL